MKFVSLKSPNGVHYLKDGSVARFENGQCDLDAKYKDEVLEAGFSVGTAPKVVDAVLPSTEMPVPNEVRVLTEDPITRETLVAAELPEHVVAKRVVQRKKG